MNGFSLKKIVWSINLKYRGNILLNLNHLKERQWLPQDEISSLQKMQLKGLLLHAYKQVPYYRKILHESEVISDDGKVNLCNFNNIPLLEKKIIHSKFEDLKSTDLPSRKWRCNTSGGSTGEPVRFVQDKNYLDWNQALKALYNEWSGYKVGECIIKVWGSERDLFVGHETPKVRLRRWSRNEVWINAFCMTPQQMRANVDKINTYRPAQILAYAESIYELAKYIEHKGIPIFTPRAIMTSAGTLHDQMRNKIEEVFQTQVFNRYGSREVGGIACECERHEGLHLSPLTHYVEILNQKGEPEEPGRIGEVVVTSLTNFAMPLIRYRIGDLATWKDGPCSCGRGWPLLKEVAGRVSDTFVTQDGALVHGEYFTHLFYFKSWIRKFQIIQEDINVIRVLIAPQTETDISENTSKELEEISQKIRLVMSQSCAVEFLFVDDIQPSSSGKYRYTISKIGNDYWKY